MQFLRFDRLKPEHWDVRVFFRSVCSRFKGICFGVFNQIIIPLVLVGSINQSIAYVVSTLRFRATLQVEVAMRLVSYLQSHIQRSLLQ